MAAINFFVGFLYEVVRSSWMISSVLMKFFLLALLLDSIRLNDFSIQSFDRRLREYGKYVVLGIGVAAVPATLLQISFTPLFTFTSQVIAVTVLGYLFWEY